MNEQMWTRKVVDTLGLTELSPHLLERLHMLYEQGYSIELAVQHMEKYLHIQK